MNPVASSPPAASTSSAFEPSARPEGLSDGAFRLLILAICAVAAAMAAEGLQTFAEMRERHHAIVARRQAVSPVSYGTPLPALHALAPSGPGVRVMVRSDSAAGGGEALCALAAATAGDASVRWIALSDDVQPCVAQRIGRRMPRVSAPAAAEMRGVRWMVMDAEGRVLYSRPTVPSPHQLRRTAALLAPMPPAEGGR